MCFQIYKLSVSQQKPSWAWSNTQKGKIKIREKPLKQRLDMSNQKPSPCLAAYLTLPHQFHQLNAICSHTTAVFLLPLSAEDFASLFIKDRKYYSLQKKLIKNKKEEEVLHFLKLITIHFTGNKVRWIHSFMAIDQNGNKWLWFNLPDSHNHHISWYSTLISTSCFPSKAIFLGLDVSLDYSHWLNVTLWRGCADWCEQNLNWLK